VGKSTLLATWREGRYPAGLALPSTIYDWLYFNYCLSSKSLLLEHLQQHRERKADDDDDELMKQKKMEIDGDVKEKENMKEVKKEAEEVVATVEAVKERREIVIEFLDTAGEYEGFRHLRPWHYKDVDVFILAFDVTNRASFANIARYWTEEIKTWGTPCVKILVGTKADIADLAEDDGGSERDQPSLFGDDGVETVVAGAEANRRRTRRTRRKVEREEAEELAKRIEAVTYVEISSVTQLNLACLLDLCVAQVFEDDNDNDNEDQEANDKPSVAETTVTTELTTASTGL
jgi:GTPase SAR1 family protein